MTKRDPQAKNEKPLLESVLHKCLHRRPDDSAGSTVFDEPPTLPDPALAQSGAIAGEPWSPPVRNETGATPTRRRRPKRWMLVPLVVLGLGVPAFVVAYPTDVPIVSHSPGDASVVWSEHGPDAVRMPEISIDSSIYPDRSGVQFLVNGDVYELDKKARPKGYDKTGPEVGSVFEIYPPLDMIPGTTIEARWLDRSRTEHRSFVTVQQPEDFYRLVDANLAQWTDADSGTRRFPTVQIDESIYPDQFGVQFAVDGSVDERCKCRRGGYDPTGPRENSNYHVYPAVELLPGQRVEARWTDLDGVAHRTTYVANAGVVAPAPTSTVVPETTGAPRLEEAVTTVAPTTTQPPIVTSPATTIASSPVTTAAPSTAAPTTTAVSTSVIEGGAEWSDIAPGPDRMPEITIDESLYPDERGVQFLVNGEPDDRNASARPDGYDATGPQDGSVFHIYPAITLQNGDRLVAKWVDASGYSHRDEVTVDGELVTSTTTASSSEPMSPPSGSEDGVNPTWTRASGEGIFPVSPYAVPAGFPSAATTGVPAGVELRQSGSLRVTEPGTVLDGLDISGDVKIEADNVTIRNSRITAGGRFVVEVGKASDGRTYSNFVIEDSRLRGVGACEAAIGYSNYTARRVHVTGCADGLKAFSNTTIVDSYIVDRYKVSDPDNSGGGTHNDGIQSSGGRNIRISGNTILGAYLSSTSAIKVTAEHNDLTDVVIEDNYLSGGAFTVYTSQKSYSATGIVVRNNTIEVGSSLFGETRNTASDATYSGNILHDPR